MKMEVRGWNPGKILGISGAYWQTCTLHAGVKLDVFTKIGEEEITGEDLSGRLQSDMRGTTMLLNALSAMGLLVKNDKKYSNTPGSKSFLCKDSPGYIGYMIMHHHHLVDSWYKLDQAVKTGSPVRTRAMLSEETRRESFLMGMFNMAMNVAPQIVKEIDLSGCSRLLDLGGGPGTYAIHFCLQNPQIKATVYDLPTTRPFAQKTIEKFGLADRINFLDGDYLSDNISAEYDAAWLSHILHGEGPEDCQKIIDKAVSTLSPGGFIIIHEFILNNTMDGPLFPALFSLNMLLGTSGGQSYSEDQLKGMLSHAGVKQIRRIPVKTPNDSGIVLGVI